MTEATPITLTIPFDAGGTRLDIALQNMMPEHSRTRLQAWIKDGLLLLDGEIPTAKTKVWGGEKILLKQPEQPEVNAFKAENIPLDIVFEDDTILVINKPVGLVVHPAAGNWTGTLLNALLHHLPALKDIPRCGIVHRLDKDTSGLLVVAKTLEAQTSLVRQLQARTVKREYRAIVWGQIWRNGTITQPIGRHPHARTKMAVTRTGKPAVTHYEVLERFGVHTYLRCQLETGRTHQIRVHLQYLKAPMLGDPVYGIGNIVPHKMMTQTLKDAVADFKRQALHAVKLGLIHPVTGEEMSWQVELADDMKAMLEAMRHEDAPNEDDEGEFSFAGYEDGVAYEYDDFDDDDAFEEDDDADLEDDDE